MWPYQARGLCGWRCIPVIVMLCVCVFLRKVQVQLRVFVCLWSVWPGTLTDGWVLVDARVLRPWEIYGFVNSGSQWALLGSDQRMCSSTRRVSAQFSQGVSVYYFSLIAHDIYSLCEMLPFYDAIVQVSVNLGSGKWLLLTVAYWQSNAQNSVQYIEPQQFWPRISNCQKYTIDPAMPKKHRFCHKTTMRSKKLFTI